MYECDRGYFEFLEYRNCEPDVRQRKKDSYRFPAERDITKTVAKGLKKIAKAFKKR